MVEITLVFLIFGALGGFMVIVNKILGPKKSSAVKDRPFECGSPYLQDKINPVPIKYYLIAFLFLLFDVEVVFFYPWALVFRQMGTQVMVVMFVYIFILAAGFIYAWKKGAFKWEG